MGFNVNALPTYVEENKSELIAKSVFGAVTVDNVTIQTGLKGKTAINILDVDVTFQDGSACGFNASGNDTFTQRFINPKHVKVDKEWCDKDLLNKYTQYEVVTAASGKELPFEAEIMGQLSDGVKAGIEKMIWEGYAGATTTGDAGEGFANIITNEVTLKETVGSDYWASLNAAYLKVPAEVLGKEDLKIYASTAYFEGLVLQLVNANLYHYNPNDKAGEITMPGTGVKIVRCTGMDKTAIKAVIARESNMFYGVDLESDSTDIDVWYSKDNKTFRATVEFVIGMQIAFPDEVVALV